LNQFINGAAAEKLAHLEHEEWARKRKRLTKDLAARALSLLDKAGNKPVQPETNCRNATGLSAVEETSTR